MENFIQMALEFLGNHQITLGVLALLGGITRFSVKVEKNRIEIEIKKEPAATDSSKN